LRPWLRQQKLSFATSWRIPFDFIRPRKLQATARSDASKIEWIISITETIDSPTRWVAFTVGCFFEERDSQKSRGFAGGMNVAWGLAND